MPVLSVNLDIIKLIGNTMNKTDKKALMALIAERRASRRDVEAALINQDTDQNDTVSSALVRGTAAVATFIPHLFIKGVESINDNTLIGSKNSEQFAADTADKFIDAGIYVGALSAEKLAEIKANVALHKDAMAEAFGMTNTEETPLERAERLKAEALKQQLADIEAQIAATK